jgi:hypothetical protein
MDLKQLDYFRHVAQLEESTSFAMWFAKKFVPAKDPV